MEEIIFNELQELKQLTLLTAKKALTMKDAAFLTGLSMSNLYKQVWKKKIPHYKSSGGKLTYFDRDELNAWMLKTRIKTADEIEQEAVNYIVTGKRSRKGVKNV